MILSLREGEILGLQPSDLDFDAADGRGTISVSKTMQRANKDALEKLDPKQVYYTFPDRREGSKSSLILKKPKTKKSNRIHRNPTFSIVCNIVGLHIANMLFSCYTIFLTCDCV